MPASSLWERDRKRIQVETRVAASPYRGKIRLTGPLCPDAVAAELSRAHVFLQHSRPAHGSIEGFGVALTEAGAAGLPLVASDIGGIPDQVEHGVNGFLHEPDDVAAQAEYMLRLARDEALDRRMGAAAREVAQRFDSTVMARKLEGEILDVIARSRR